ncbi:hypothetical protein K402DRAFT_457426 [Aulographum hederae CBS 113979]|uniref:BTB domain-containing protein n=1 Tax=Aulographum hederae CBS 113979 TaxID=1176131 RepID=A0A6G1GNC7_9PEZI|nr:hypothetical protein K402DRAFT_457426 [Aulographum hederae CBS 113979]
MSSKKARLSYSQTDLTSVTIRIGIDAVPVQVNKDILCHHSNYFDNLFNKGFKETETLDTNLQDVSIATFKTFLDWMHNGELEFPAELPESGYNQTTEDLKVFAALLDVYMLAEKYDIPDLRVSIIKRWQAVQAATLTVENTVLINEIYERLPGPDPLKQIVVQRKLHSKFSLSKDQVGKWTDQICREFLVDLLIAGSEKAPSVIRSGPRTVWEKHMCNFHEHSTEEEKVACKEAWIKEKEKLTEWCKKKPAQPAAEETLT